MSQTKSIESYAAPHAAANANSAALLSLRWFIVGAGVLTASLYVSVSWRWKLMGNPPLMHYVVFLIHRGLRPYSEITDSNMPGSYLTQGAAIAIFGASDFSWRLYEFFLMGMLSAAMVAIARRWDWLAGALAATLFVALHAAEGPEYAGERDLVAAVLLMISVAILLECLDRRRPLWMLGAGVAWGLAAWMKPTFLGFPAGLALLALYVSLRRKETPWMYLLWASVGILLPCLLVLAFLLRLQVLPDFVHVLTSALPSYRRMPGGSTSWIGYRSLPKRCLVLLLPALLLWISPGKRRQLDWRLATLLASAGFGLLSFVAQGKGFVYHRYAFVSFALLLAAIILVPLLNAPGWRRGLAAATAVLALAAILPYAWRSARALGTQSDLAVSFQRDLETLGGRAQLEDKVQCLDLSYGCLNALYHLRIVENSAFTGDMMLFRPEPSPMRELSRAVFWQRAQRDPASVLMISNQSFSLDDGFGRLAHWPEFTRYLEANYIQVAERRFEHEHFGGRFSDPVPPAEQDAYRLYMRRRSPLLAEWGKLHASFEEAQVNADAAGSDSALFASRDVQSQPRH